MSRYHQLNLILRLQSGRCLLGNGQQAVFVDDAAVAPLLVFNSLVADFCLQQLCSGRGLID